jgi:hypothetical protein
MVVSVLFNAPLGEAANPGMSPNPAKAPWYFVGLQELLLHFHPLFAVVIIPLVTAVALVFIPYYRYDTSTAGAWFLSHKGRRVGSLAALAAAVATPMLIFADEFVLDMTGWFPGIPSVVRSGLLPTLVVGAALVLFYVFLKRKHGASNNEAIQAMFILLTVVLVILTGIGVWFRGPGMALTWPWSL